MKVIEAFDKLKAISLPVLQTKEAASILDVSVEHASQILRRLAASGAVDSLKRGLWLIDKNISPYQLIAYITAPFPSYLSLQSALYFHGMISQIPESIYVASVARSHQLQTTVASYSVHHINPKFFLGFSLSPKENILIADCEKALIDFLYLSPSKSKHFYALPEIEFPRNFSQKRALKYIKLIPSLRTRTLVQDKFKKLINQRA